MNRYENKIVAVTGGGSGIGEAMVRRFASEGAQVAIIDRDMDNARRVAVDCGRSVQIFSCDVSDSSDVERCFEEITSNLGPVNVLVNNAGIACIGKLEDTSAEEFEKVMRVNVQGAFHCSKAAIEGMKEQGGVILNMTSVASHVGLPDRLAYGTSKGAVLSMTYSIAVDYLEQGIRCNAISPARVHTPFVDGYLEKNYPGQEQEMFDKLSKTQPIGRMGKPEEIAGLAAYLCSEEASFITGAAYAIDGGFMKLFP